MTPTIDTLISALTLFSTVGLGVFTFIGGLIIAKGIAQDQRTDKAIEKIEKMKDHIEEIEKNVQAIFNQAQAALTKITEREQGLQKVTTDLEERLKQADIKNKKSEALLSYLEYRANAYSNTMQGSTHLFKSPFEVANQQAVTNSQFSPAVYANPIAQPPPLQAQGLTLNSSLISTGSLNPSLVTTGRNVVSSLQVEQATIR